MYCPKCGEKNIEEAKFCCKCGTNLQELKAKKETKETKKEEIKENSKKETTEKVSKKEVVVKKEVKKNTENIFNDIFTYILFAFLKPFETFKKSSKKLCTTTNSLIFSGIICGSAWILSIISTIISGAKTTSYGWSGSITTWQFGNLNYIKIIFVNLLVYAALIAAIAGVYCLGSIIVKKTISYFKMLTITCTAIVPYILCAVFLAPLFGLIHSYVAAVIAIAGLVYSVLIFFGLIKDELEFKTKEQSLYFHLICAGVLAIAFYITYINFGTMNVLRNTTLLDYLNF